MYVYMFLLYYPHINRVNMWMEGFFWVCVGWVKSIVNIVVFNVIASRLFKFRVRAFCRSLGGRSEIIYSEKQAIRYLCAMMENWLRLTVFTLAAFDATCVIRIYSVLSWKLSLRAVRAWREWYSVSHRQAKHDSYF